MKGFKGIGLIATVAAFAICASALAQDGPPQPGEGGQPGQAGPGMRGGLGRRMGPPPEPLVFRPDVQKELRLTDDQIKKLRSIMRPPAAPFDGPDGKWQGRGPGGRGQAGPGDPPPADDQEAPPNGGPPQDDMGGPPPAAPQGGPDQTDDGPDRPGGGPQAMDAKLKRVLSESQMNRLKQLQLQRMGAEAMPRPEVAEKLGLSPGEIDKICGVIDEAHQTMPRPEQGQRPDRAKMMKAHQEMLAKINDKVFPMLTSSELSKWRDLTGKPFKFDETYRPQPPRAEG